MFHIYNKIVAANDVSLNPDLPSITISKLKNLGVAEDLIKNMLTNFKQCQIYSDTYENLVGSGKRFENDYQFFNNLCSQETTNDFYVYLDQDAYLTLFVKFVKLLLQNIDMDHAYTFYCICMNKAKLYYGYLGDYIFQMSPHFGSTELAQTLKIIPKEEFQEIYNNVEFNASENEKKTLRNLIIPKCSLEFLIASVLYDKNSKYMAILEPKIRNIVYRNAVNYLHEVRSDILCRTFDLNDHIEGLPKPDYEKDAMDYIKEYVPEVMEMLEYDVTNESLSPEEIEEEQKNLTRYHKFIEQVYLKNEINEGHLIRSGKGKIDSRYMTYVGLLDKTPIEVFEEDIKYNKLNISELTFPRWVQGRKINTILLSYLYTAYSNNVKEDLRAFSL